MDPEKIVNPRMTSYANRGSEQPTMLQDNQPATRPNDKMNPFPKRTFTEAFGSVDQSQPGFCELRIDSQ